MMLTQVCLRLKTSRISYFSLFLFQVVTPFRQSPSELSLVVGEIGMMNPFNSSLKVHFPLQC